jgi:hypothetical protein
MGASIGEVSLTGLPGTDVLVVVIGVGCEGDRAVAVVLAGLAQLANTSV